MSDYLEKICVNLGIRLLYTNNKQVILSAEVKDKLSALRVHKLFKNCPPKIAQAIVNFYTDEANKPKHEEIILGYVNQLYPSNSFRIKSSKSEVKEDIIKDVKENSNIKDPSLVEFDISSLVVKDFWGNERKSKSNNLIEPSDNDFLELDIIIKPPVT